MKKWSRSGRDSVCRRGGREREREREGGGGGRGVVEDGQREEKGMERGREKKKK